MDEQEISGKLGEEIEAEWAVVNQWLAKNDEASAAMAVLEAHKIFVQVLSEVSYGANFQEMIHSAGGIFRDPAKILAAHRVFEHLTDTRIGHRIKKSDAVIATDDLLRGILDMTGRDAVGQGVVERALAGLNYFWLNHPNFLAGVIGIVLVAVALIWFLADTTIGHWVVTMATGFEQFVLGQPSLLISLMVALILAILLGYWLASRQDR